MVDAYDSSKTREVTIAKSQAQEELAYRMYKVKSEYEENMRKINDEHNAHVQRLENQHQAAMEKQAGAFTESLKSKDSKSAMEYVQTLLLFRS